MKVLKVVAAYAILFSLSLWLAFPLLAEAQEAKFRGTIVSFTRSDSGASLQVQVTDVDFGASIGETIQVDWFGPRALCVGGLDTMDSGLGIGSHVEVYGETYIDMPGVHLACPPHYLKKINGAHQQIQFRGTVRSIEEQVDVIDLEVASEEGYRAGQTVVVLYLGDVSTCATKAAYDRSIRPGDRVEVVGSILGSDAMTVGVDCTPDYVRLLSKGEKLDFCILASPFQEVREIIPVSVRVEELFPGGATQTVTTSWCHEYGAGSNLKLTAPETVLVDGVDYRFQYWTTRDRKTGTEKRSRETSMTLYVSIEDEDAVIAVYRSSQGPSNDWPNQSDPSNPLVLDQNGRVITGAPEGGCTEIPPVHPFAKFVECKGQINPGQDWDWMRVYLKAGQTLTAIALPRPELDVELVILGNGLSKFSNTGGRGAAEEIRVQIPVTGIYDVAVQETNGRDIGDWTLHLKIEEGGAPSGEASLINILLTTDTIKAGDAIEIKANLCVAKAPAWTIQAAPVSFFIDDQLVGTVNTADGPNYCYLPPLPKIPPLPDQTPNVSLRYQVPKDMIPGSHTLRAVFHGGNYYTAYPNLTAFPNFLPSEREISIKIVSGEGEASVLNFLPMVNTVKVGDTIKIRANLCVAKAPAWTIQAAPIEFYFDGRLIATKNTEDGPDLCYRPPLPKVPPLPDQVPNAELDYKIPLDMLGGSYTLKAVFRGGKYFSNAPGLPALPTWLPAEAVTTINIVTGDGEATFVKLRLLPDTGKVGDTIHISASVCQAKRSALGLEGASVDFFIDGQLINTKKTIGAFCDLFGGLQITFDYRIPSTLPAGSHEVKAVFSGATDLAQKKWLPSQETQLLTVVGGSFDVTAVARAVDSNQNSLIDDKEIVKAADIWATGQTISDVGPLSTEDFRLLVAYWVLEIPLTQKLPKEPIVIVSNYRLNPGGTTNLRTDDTIRISRNISEQTVAPGDTIEVSIEIVANADIGVVGFVELLPQGWKTEGNDFGVLTDLKKGETRVLKYIVTVPSTAEGTYELLGYTKSQNSGLRIISGQSSLIVTLAKLLSVEEALAGTDLLLSDEEFLRAKKLWTSHRPVPRTNGHVLTDEEMLRLYVHWRDQTPVSLHRTTAALAQFAIQRIRLSTVANAWIFESIGTGIETSNIRIYNLAGKLMFEQEATSNTIRFYGEDMRGNPLPNGVYLYMITVKGRDNQTYRSEVRKLVIMR